MTFPKYHIDHTNLERRLIRCIARADEWCDVLHDLDSNLDVTSRIQKELSSLAADMRRLGSVGSNTDPTLASEGSPADFRQLYRELSRINVDIATNVEDVRNILREDLYRYLVLLELETTRGLGETMSMTIGTTVLSVHQFLEFVLFVLEFRLDRLERLRIALLISKNKTGVVNP